MCLPSPCEAVLVSPTSAVRDIWSVPAYILSAAWTVPILSGCMYSSVYCSLLRLLDCSEGVWYSGPAYLPYRCDFDCFLAAAFEHGKSKLQVFVSVDITCFAVYLLFQEVSAAEACCIALTNFATKEPKATEKMYTTSTVLQRVSQCCKPVLTSYNSIRTHTTCLAYQYKLIPAALLRLCSSVRHTVVAYLQHCFSLSA